MLKQGSAALLHRRAIGTMMLGLMSLIVLLSGSYAYQRYSDFLSYHQSIAQGAAAELAEETRRFLEDRHRTVLIFSEDYHDAIMAVYRAPDEFSLQQELEERIKRYFPDFFAFTVTDPDGNPVIEDFEGYVSDLCIADVRRFAGSGLNPVRIHPNPYVYHFDVMAPVSDQEEDQGVLLISFHADYLGNLLKAGEVPGHQLIIYQPMDNDERLIEVTSAGARDKVVRDDYRMTDEEKGRIISDAEIEGTRWVLADLYRPGFRQAYLNKLLLTQGGVVLGIIAVLGVVWFFIYRLDKRRASAEQIKDEFIGVVSHELRTPITSMHGALSLLEHQYPNTDSQYRELFRIARDNTQRLRILVDDLLDIRKIESNSLELNLQNYDVQELVDASLVDNHGYAVQCGVSFVAGNKLEQVMVRVDRSRFNQIMANLLSNAAKFSSEGGSVRVDTSSVDAGRVRISVADHGAGIPEAQQSRLFEKFFQADSSSSRKVAGTGLGLAIVKALVEQQGGTVGFSSRVGEGSVFWFELPVTG